LKHRSAGVLAVGQLKELLDDLLRIQVAEDLAHIARGELGGGSFSVPEPG
jgi:hypothetical protein